MFRRKQDAGPTRRELRALVLEDRQRMAEWWSRAEKRMKTREGDLSAASEAVAITLFTARRDQGDAAAGVAMRFMSPSR
jgi:hypothetical protein